MLTLQIYSTIYTISKIQSSQSTQCFYPSRVSSISLGSYGSEETACLTTQGGAYCWGSNAQNQTDLSPLNTDNQFDAGVIKIVTSPQNTCVIIHKGKVLCMGQSGDTTSNITAAKLDEGAKDIALGFSHTCGINYYGTLNCWGSNANGQTDIPTTNGADFTLDTASVKAQGNYTCALDLNRQMFCWGGDNLLNGVQSIQLNGYTSDYIQDLTITETRVSSESRLQFSQLKLYDWSNNLISIKSVTCVNCNPCTGSEGPDKIINLSGKFCDYNHNQNGQSRLIIELYSQSSIKQQNFVTANDSSERDPSSWNLKTQTQSTNHIIDQQSNVSFTNTRNSSTANQQLLYSTSPNYIRVNQGSGVIDYSLQLHHICAIQSTGNLNCSQEAYNQWGQADVPSGFTSGSIQVTGGQYHSCGLKSGGVLSCWGAVTYNTVTYDSGQTTLPVGKFLSNTLMIAAASNQTCGVDSTGQLYCFGDNTNKLLWNETLDNGDKVLCIPCRTEQTLVQSKDRCLTAKIDNCELMTNDSTLIQPKCYQCVTGYIALFDQCINWALYSSYLKQVLIQGGIVLLSIIILVWCRHFYKVSKVEQGIFAMSSVEATEEHEYDIKNNARRCRLCEKRIKNGQLILTFEDCDCGCLQHHYCVRYSDVEVRECPKCNLVI